MSKLEPYARLYSTSPSENPGIVTQGNESENLEVSNKITIPETTKNVSCRSIVKSKYAFSPRTPNIEYDDIVSFASIGAPFRTEKADLVGSQNDSRKANYTPSSLLNLKSCTSNYHFNTKPSRGKNTLPYNMTFGSLNFSTSILTQPSNSSSYETVSSATAAKCIKSPYVLNLSKKIELNSLHSVIKNFAQTEKVGLLESEDNISTKEYTEAPKQYNYSLESQSLVSLKSKKMTERSYDAKIGPISSSGNSERVLSDLEYITTKNLLSQPTSVPTLSLTISDDTTCGNVSIDAPKDVVAAKDVNAVDEDENAAAVPNQQRTKPTTVSFVEREIKDTARSKNMPISYFPSFKSFVKVDSHRSKYSMGSEITMGGGYTSYAKRMISFQSRGSIYSWRNIVKGVDNQSYSCDCITQSNDNIQSSSARPAPPYNWSSINITQVPSSSATPSNFSLDSDDNSIASISDVVDMCMMNKLRKWKTKSGFRFINQYQILEDIGHGTCARVKLAYDSVNSRLVALKEVLRADHKQRLGGPTQAQLNHESFMREVSVMKRLRHRNIVHLYEVIDDPNADELYLVMQYVDKGVVADIQVNNNTDKVCEPIPPLQLVQIARQALAGLEYLHRHNVVHRDIKPQNILLDSNGVVYLSDFGLAEVFDKQYLHRMHQMMEKSMALSKDLTNDAHDHVEKIWGVKGTVLFIAPEIWQGSSINGKPVDIWAMGVTLFTLLTGRLPFTTIDAVRDPTKPVIPTEYGVEWVELLKGMLERDPKKRMTVSRARLHVKKIIQTQTEQHSTKAVEITDSIPQDEQLSPSEGIGHELNRMSSFESQRKLISPRSPEQKGIESDLICPEKPTLGASSPTEQPLSTPPSSVLSTNEPQTFDRRCCPRCRWKRFCISGGDLPNPAYGKKNRYSEPSMKFPGMFDKQANCSSLVTGNSEVPVNASGANAENQTTDSFLGSLKCIYTFPRPKDSMNLPYMLKAPPSSRFSRNKKEGHPSSSTTKISMIKDPKTNPMTLSPFNPLTPQATWSKAPTQLPPILNLFSTAPAKTCLKEVSHVSPALSHRTDPLNKDASEKY